jgi:hypothetical protein
MPNSVPAIDTLGVPSPPRMTTTRKVTGIEATAASMTSRSEPNRAARTIAAAAAKPTSGVGFQRGSMR